MLAVILMFVKLMELHKTVQNLKEKSQVVQNGSTTDLTSRALNHPPNSNNQTTEDDGSFDDPTSNDTDAESYTTCTLENNDWSPSKYTSFSNSSEMNIAEEELNKENKILMPQDNADSLPLHSRQTAEGVTTERVSRNKRKRQNIEA